MNISIILAGGIGRRFGSELPKQYQLLMGQEVIFYSVRAMKNSSLTNLILIVADHEHIERLVRAYGVQCITGAASRNGSIKNALEHIAAHYPQCRKVFINEAARPFLSGELVDKYYEYLETYDAVITAKHITDSLGRYGEAVTNRDEYYLIQAPEAFRFELLRKNFSQTSPITATVQQLPPASKVKKFFAYNNNMKITYQEDLLYAEHIMKLGCQEVLYQGQ